MTIYARVLKMAPAEGLTASVWMAPRKPGRQLHTLNGHHLSCQNRQEKQLQLAMLLVKWKSVGRLLFTVANAVEASWKGIWKS